MTGAYEALSSALLALPAVLAGLAALAAARLGPGGGEWDYSASTPRAWRGSRTLLAGLLLATAAAAGAAGAVAGVEWGAAVLAAGFAASHAAGLEASRRMAERALLSQPPEGGEGGWEPLKPPAALRASATALAGASLALLAAAIRAGLPWHAASVPLVMAALQSYYAAMLARGLYPYPPPPGGAARLLAYAGLHAPGLAAALAALLAV